MITLVLLALAVVCYGQDKSKTIAENLEKNHRCILFRDILKLPLYTNVWNLLNDTTQSLTLFAPDDAAMTEALAAGFDVTAALPNTQLFYYHIVSGNYPVKDLSDLHFLPTNMKSPNYVSLGPGKPQVLSASKSGSSGLHINWGIPGDREDTGRVVSYEDDVASNGVMHMVAKLASIPPNVTTQASRAGLNNFLQAVNTSGLSSVINGQSLMIFAPTDAAFRSSGWDKWSADKLKTVLQYHLVPSVSYSNQLTNGQILSTYDGDQTLTVSISRLSTTIKGSTNAATLSEPNILIKNGVIHAIDTVLIPSGV